MSYFFYTLAYLIVLELVLSLLLLPVLFVRWSDHGALRILHYALKWFVFSSYFLAVPWIAGKATRRRTEMNEGFKDALSGALDEFRLVLSFLPIIGALFQRRTTPSGFDDPTPLG